MYHDEKTLRAMLGSRFPEEAPFEVSRLSGGVSSLVFMARAMSGRQLVIKQSLAELAVNEHWPAPRERIFNEVRGMRIVSGLVGSDHVPEIAFVDESDYLYGMEAVPRDAVLFKDALLSGGWTPEWFESAGKLLGQIHAADPGSFAGGGMTRADIEAFQKGDLKLFDSLRLDPYFRHVARTRPEFAELMARAVKISSGDRRSFVHGDFSPKNIFVVSETGRMILLDFEVMHIGNPAFDVAFFLTHPLAKAIHRPHQAKNLGDGIRRFWDAYNRHCGTRGAGEHEVLILWSAIATARVIGKSPLEYLNSDREKTALLGWGDELVRQKIASIEAAASRVAQGF